MALKLDVMHKGIPVPQAYINVVLPTVTVDKASIEFGAWYCAAAGTEHFHAVTYTAPYDLEGANPFEQAYVYLKSLPEFEGCHDC